MLPIGDAQRTGIADGWEIEFRPPVTAAAVEIQKMKITTKSQIEILLPELKPNKVTNAHCYHFRPTIGNTHVICRFFYIVRPLVYFEQFIVLR